jgi:HK97 family phage portal protein
MKFFGWTIGKADRSNSPENPNVPLTGEVLTGLFGGMSMAGLSVTQETAMKLSAFQACMRILAETVASLPLDVFVRATGGGKALAWRHPLYSLLHTQPNPEQTSFSFRETMLCHILGWGNAYVQTVWNGSGQITQMWLVHPSLVTKYRAADQSVWFRVTAGNRTYDVPAGVMVHVMGLSLNGWLGRSIVDLGVNALGQAQAIDTFTSKYFANGAFPSGFLSTEKSLSEDARKRVQAGWQAAYAGVAMAHKTAVFEEGLKWNALTVDPEKAQLLLTKTFMWAEIASLFRVPLFLVGVQDKTSTWGTGIEQMMIGFATFTIRPWLVRLEQAFNAYLFLPSEQGLYFAEFNIDGLLRGDYKSRQEGLAIQRQNGIINGDEWRAVENMNPQPSGQGSAYWMPVNMTTADKIAAASPGSQRALLVATCDLLAKREASETRKLLARNLPPAEFLAASPSALDQATADDTLVQVVQSLLPREKISRALSVIARFRDVWAETTASDLAPMVHLPEPGAYVRSITEQWTKTRAKREAETLWNLIQEESHEA